MKLDEEKIAFVKKSEKNLLYILVSEECAELIQACCKIQRILAAEPTPARPELVQENLREEISDVFLVSQILGLNPSEEICAQKLNRWVQRLKGESNEQW